MSAFHSLYWAPGKLFLIRKAKHFYFGKLFCIISWIFHTFPPRFYLSLFQEFLLFGSWMLVWSSNFPPIFYFFGFLFCFLGEVFVYSPFSASPSSEVSCFLDVVSISYVSEDVIFCCFVLLCFVSFLLSGLFFFVSVLVFEALRERSLAQALETDGKEADFFLFSTVWVSSCGSCCFARVLQIQYL